MTVDFDAALRPYLDKLRSDVGPLALYDAHTHIGRNDPDGYAQEPGELLASLEACDARALVFPMSEPGGYGDGVANDEVIATAQAHPDRLAALCRVDPNEGEAAVAEAERALAAGARGIKLHPRGQRFTLSHPQIGPLLALAHEHRAPVMIHAGRGIPALGEDTVRLSERYRGARLILAHAGISDIAWLWRALPDHPNVFVDTSWWNPADVLALMTLAPPGQVLWASDSPYGTPIVAAVEGLRCAVQAGYSPEQIQSYAGGQLVRIVAGDDPADLGPALRRVLPLDPTLERVVTHLCTVVSRAFVRADFDETLALARLACAVAPADEVAPVCRAVLDLLDRFEAGFAPPEPGRGHSASLSLLIAALFIARTPAAGVP